MISLKKWLTAGLLLFPLFALAQDFSEEEELIAPQDYSEEVDTQGPWMICDVSVSGLKNIRKRTVTKAAHAKKGQLYDRYIINEDIQDISALGNFVEYAK